MGWSSLHTYDRDGNKSKKIDFDPNIIRDGNGFRNIKEKTDQEYYDYQYQKYLFDKGLPNTLHLYKKLDKE
tara:strand:+ start:3717 stop:3929 length:213 start_codon:yes stop_codon:yes gene_type:complete